MPATNLTPADYKFDKKFEVVLADGDTTLDIAHGLAADHADMVAASLDTGITDAATAKARLRVSSLASVAPDKVALVAFSFPDKDTVRVTKAAGAGTGCTFWLRILLPHSIGR